MKQFLSVFNYSITNQNESTLDIHVDGYIVDAPTQELYREFWGDETSVSYKSIRDQVNKANPQILNLYVNSGGGHVGDAMAIHDWLNELESKGVTVNRIGRGIIASAATYLVMGKNSQISENSFFMIHNVGGAVWGDVNVIENYARTLRKFNNLIVDFYSNNTGKSKEQVSDWMNAETWFSGKEAVDNGFVKNLTGSVQFTNSISTDHWQYSNTAILNAYNSQINNPDNMNDKIKQVVNSVLKELGLIKNKEGENKPVEPISQEALDAAFTNALKSLNLEETDEVSNSLKETITNSIKDAIKDLPTNEAFNSLKLELEEVKKDVANKGGKQTVSPENSADNSKFAHAGISWGEAE